MSYEDLENWENQSQQITNLTENLNKIIESACNENYFGVKELEEIQGKMSILLEQGMFWRAQENAQRFVYDLKEFTMWVCNYCEEIEGSWNEEE